MKRIRHILLLLAGILVASLVSYIIIKGNADLYLRAIPMDANAIAKIDFNCFVRDSKLSAVEKLQIVQSWFKKDNAANIGLDLERPVYGFVSANGNVGFVASVRNQDDFADCVEAWVEEGICTPLIRQRGYAWSQVDHSFILAFDGHKAMIMGPVNVSDYTDIQEEMIELLEQNGNQSAIQSTLFKQLRETTTPVACIMNFDMIPLKLRSMIGSYFKVHNPNDLLLELTMESIGNEIDIDAKFITEKKEVKEQFKTIENTFHRINGNFIKKTIDHHAIWTCFNTNGSTLLTFLRLNDSVRMGLVALNVIVDADNAIRAINGDVMINTTADMNYSSLVVAEITSKSFLDNINSWISQSKGVLHHIEGDTYAMNVGHDYLTFGVQDKYLYIHSPQSRPQILRDEMFGSGHAYLLENYDDIKNARFYATIDVPTCLGISGNSISNGTLNSLISNLKRIDIRMNKADSWKFCIKANDNFDFSKKLLLPN